MGPFWKEDIDSRRSRPGYVIRPVAPYFCRETGKVISNYLPHLVIRQGIGFHMLPHAFYRQTIEAKNESVRIMLKELRRGKESNLTDVIKKWCPGAPIDSILNLRTTRERVKKYGELLSSIARLDFLEKLRRQVESPDYVLPKTPEFLEQDNPGTGNPQIRPISKIEVIRNIAILQDTHQIKLLCMEDHNIYSDSDMKKESSIFRKFPKIYEDGLHAVMHQGALPDLASIQCYLSFWDRTCETSSKASNPFENDPFARAILRIFTKAIFQPSKVREIHKSLYEELEPQFGDFKNKVLKADRRRLVSFFSRLIMCSLLGMYEHAEYIPDFHARREIYRWLSYDVPTIQDMQNWFLEHKLLITFILRENHIFTLKDIPGLERIFKELYEYTTLRNHTQKSMDTIKEKIGNSITRTQNALEVFYQTKVDAGMTREEVNEWRRYVNRRHFVIRCALLMNSGEMIYNFISKFGGKDEDPRMVETVQFIFWKFIRVDTFTDIAKHFEHGSNMESDFRNIIVYWLLLRDCCHQSSRIQTKMEYEKCYSECANGQLVAPLPEKYKSITSYRNIRNLAVESEEKLQTNFICKLKHSGQNCKCLRRIIDSLVGNFDVLRLLDPDNARSSSEYPSLAYHGIEKYLSTVYTTCLNYCYRPRLTSFAEEIVSSCGAVRNIFANSSILMRNARCTREEADAFIKNFEQAHQYYKERRFKIRKIIETVVNSFEPSKEIGIGWMIQIFKIRYESVIEMDEAFRAMWTETNHRCPYNATFEIAKKRPRDFWILRSFFKIRHRRESIRLYPISKEITQEQIKTLHEELNVVPNGHKLPEEATTYYYCPHHKRLLAPRVGTDCGEKGYINTHTIGPELVSIDPLTDKKYCTIHTGRSGSRRCIVKEIIPEDELESGRKISIPKRVINIISDPVSKIAGVNIDDIEESMEEEEEEEEENEALKDDYNSEEENDKSISGRRKKKRKKGKESQKNESAKNKGTSKNVKPKSKKKKYSKCAVEPLQSINLLGKIFMLYKNMYVLCPKCGRAMRLTREKWSEIGLWCGCCLRGKQQLSEKLGIPWDHVKKKPNFFIFPKTIQGVKVFSNPMVCFYCKNQKLANRPLTFFLMYNDLDLENGCHLGYYPFCRFHSKWYFGRSTDAMRLSNIVYCLNLLSKCTSSAETRKFTPRSIRVFSESSLKVKNSKDSIEVRDDLNQNIIIMPTILYDISDIEDEELQEAQNIQKNNRKTNRRMRRSMGNHFIKSSSQTAHK